MSWTVNGITWTPQSAATHSQTNLTYLNNLNVAPTLVASPTNAIWLNYLGVGGLQQAYDAKLYAASQSFNVVTCDDSQVLNLAPVAGTSPLPATYSTVSLNVTAAAAGSATVNSGTLAPWNGINFVVGTTTVIPAGTTVAVFCTADTAGPYLALAGQVTSFSTSIPNVQTVTNPASSTQGSATETTATYRQRLVAGNGTVNWDLNGTITAIRALQGIISANVFFNSDTVAVLTLNGGVTVQPRHARIVIQGGDVSGELATTYATRMTAPTDGTSSETYTYLSGQTLTVNYDIATPQNVYVTIYYDPTMPLIAGADTIAKNLIVAQNSTFTVGQSITAQSISQGPLDNFTYATITGVTVSIDGVTYSRNAIVPANEYPSFSTANIFWTSGP